MSTSRSRRRLSLDGAWQFRTDASDTWRTVSVPAPWQAQGDDLRDYTGAAWYKTTFENISLNGEVTALGFGAVDYLAEVWVNGAPAGSHEGGYLPFELDVTALVRHGLNELLVRVTDPSDEPSGATPPFSEIAHGKQSWYGPLSGIWQPVWVEARPAVHITRLRATPDARAGTVTVDVALSGAADLPVALEIRDPDGSPVASAEARPGVTTLAVPGVVRWDLDRPARYTLTASAGEDRTSVRFGFRTFEAKDGALYLNDRPLMLRAALDQDYYPDLTCTPPSYEYLLHQAQLARRMGLNCLRCHIKAADPRYLEAADEAGLLVWAELPNWRHWTPEGGRRGLEQLLGQIERDWHHPSVVIWSVINEGWGLDLVRNPEHRAWLLEAFETVKAATPLHLIVDNSACFPNFHLKTDIDDFHFYAAMPDERDRWRRWVAEFAGRAHWSFGREQPFIPYNPLKPTERWELGEAGYGPVLPEVQRRGDEPLIMSEFGNWGLPSLASLRGASGRDPWWFETGDDWGDGVVYPHGVERRFARLGLGKIFGDYERFAAATRRAELDALRFEIEEMRRHPSIGGYVITEFTDVHWECNGLLDMMRAPKMPLDALADLNADTTLIADREQGALWSGEERNVAVHVSHWGAHPLEAPELRWALVGGAEVLSGALSCTAVAMRSTASLGAVHFAAPEVMQPTRFTLRLELWDAGRRMAGTEVHAPVYPRLAPERAAELDRVIAALRAEGATTTDLAAGGERRRVVVARRVDEELLGDARAGVRVLLLAEDHEAIPPGLLGQVWIAPRRGTAWQGSWASSFAWMAGGWAGDGVLDESFAAVMPDHVVVGFAQAAFPAEVTSGLCVGWIQKPVALAGRQRVGRGTVLASTFRIAAAGVTDPVAAWVLEELLRSAAE